MVPACAELANGAAAQREVDASLDAEGIVAPAEALEGRHELARVCEQGL
jgi:hypothetical protein